MDTVLGRSNRTSVGKSKLKQAEVLHLEVPLPSCAILVDRHTHKNAGTTMRSIYRSNDMHDDWFLWGYNPSSAVRVSLDLLEMLVDARRSWKEARRGAIGSNSSGGLVRASAAGANDASGSCVFRAPLRLVMEHHYTRLTTETVVGLFGPHTPLRHAAARCGCRVVLFTRLREPLSYYMSFYRWTVWWRQQKNASGYGRDLFEWAPPNLQSTILLDPARGARRARSGKTAPRSRKLQRAARCSGQPHISSRKTSLNLFSTLIPANANLITRANDSRRRSSVYFQL